MSLLPSRPAGERTIITIINSHAGDVLSASGDTFVVFSSFLGANAQRRVIKGNFSKQIKKTRVFSPLCSNYELLIKTCLSLLSAASPPHVG